MNALVNIPLVTTPAPVAPALPALAAPAPAPAPVPSGAVRADDQVDLSNAQAVQQALQPKPQIANTQVLGTGTFAIFAVGNTLYTRLTTRDEDGSVKVTLLTCTARTQRNAR